jgi:hypothetical protein
VNSAARDFVLFKTDFYVFHQHDEDIDQWFVGGDCAGWFYVRLLLVDQIRPDCDPVMEDWGWTFAVSVDGLRVRVSVWAFFEIENCWLFGLEAKGGWFRPRSRKRRIAAKEAVARALESIMEADSRMAKRSWFADNPFELDIMDF